MLCQVHKCLKGIKSFYGIMIWHYEMPALVSAKCLWDKWFLMKWHRSFFVPMSIITNLQLNFDWKKMKKKTFFVIFD
jgi:hypothetical protein